MEDTLKNYNFGNNYGLRTSDVHYFLLAALEIVMLHRYWYSDVQLHKPCYVV